MRVPPARMPRAWRHANGDVPARRVRGATAEATMIAAQRATLRRPIAHPIPLEIRDVGETETAIAHLRRRTRMIDAMGETTIRGAMRGVARAIAAGAEAEAEALEADGTETTSGGGGTRCWSDWSDWSACLPTCTECRDSSGLGAQSNSLVVISSWQIASCAHRLVVHHPPRTGASLDKSIQQQATSSPNGKSGSLCSVALLLDRCQSLLPYHYCLVELDEQHGPTWMLLGRHQMCRHSRRLAHVPSAKPVWPQCQSSSF